MTLTALGKEKAVCDPSSEGILHSYEAVVQNKNTGFHLNCLIGLYQSGSGFTAILAGTALRPLMGGHALQGRTMDAETKKAAKQLQALALKAADPVQDSFLSQYSKGTWGTYTLFCNPQSSEFCTLFLPDEKQVMKESALIGSSSMILLRTAYLKLSGEDRKLVEDRIRNLYQSISTNDPLKRKVIDQIYQELFLQMPTG